MTAGLRTRLTAALLAAIALPALVAPLACLVYIAAKGAPALDWTFLSTAGEGARFGASSGILPQITGSLLLALGACAVATPAALGAGLYHRYLASTRGRATLDYLLQLIQGIPPIVFGLWGLVLFVHLLAWGVSLAAGTMVLAVIVLPTLTQNTIAALARVPDADTEAVRSLGLSEAATIRRVWLPRAWPGLLTGLSLGIARALSETAPILFTATVFSGIQWPDSAFSPVTSLQTHIFYLAQEGGDPEAMNVAWGSAAVLIFMVIAFSFFARSLQRWTQS